MDGVDEDTRWYGRPGRGEQECGPFFDVGVRNAWRKDWIDDESELRADAPEGWTSVGSVVRLAQAFDGEEILTRVDALEDELEDPAWSVREPGSDREHGPVSVRELMQLAEKWVLDERTRIKAWTDDETAPLIELLTVGRFLFRVFERWRLPALEEAPRGSAAHTERIAHLFRVHLSLRGSKRWFALPHLPDSVQAIATEARTERVLADDETALGFGGLYVKDHGPRGMLMTDRALYRVADGRVSRELALSQISAVPGYGAEPDYWLAYVRRDGSIGRFSCTGFGKRIGEIAAFLARVPPVFEPPNAVGVLAPLKALRKVEKVDVPNLCAGTLRRDVVPPARLVWFPEKADDLWKKAWESDAPLFAPLETPSAESVASAARALDKPVEKNFHLTLPVSERCRGRQVARFDAVFNGHARLVFFNRGYGELFAERNGFESLDPEPPDDDDDLV